MLVYGDIERIDTPAAMRAAIVATLDDTCRLPPGLARHAALVRAFLCTAELVQGLADAEFNRTGMDDLTRIQTAGGHLLCAMAECVGRSWQMPGTPLELASDWREHLDMLDGPYRISMRQPEGYAHYALYPESYLEAAQSSGLGPETVVIGIRSIGTSLAAMVAAALGAAPAVTVRPVGHPFARHLSLSASLEAALLSEPAVSYAIVDEGPGLSGSSFNCVADWLEARGVDADRIHFFPGHAGDLGQHANPAHRQRWSSAHKHVVEFDAFLPRERLAEWVAEVLGPLDAPLTDISGGAWRTLRYARERDWPPADRQMEKRKFLAKVRGRTWLVKFAGIGDIGEDKFARAKALSGEGLVPEPLAFRHGFLVEPWIDAAPFNAQRVNRSHLLGQIARHLTARQRLPAPQPGATLDDLFAMAIQNAGECLGEAARERVAARLGDPAALSGRVRPIASDNRMHAWEWLSTPEGDLLKADALDHCVGHDLIGCQDISWDIAGAVAEFALTIEERERLISEIAACSGRNVEPALLASMELCYLAFQIGLWTDALARSDGGEGDRIQSILDGYTTRLSALIA